MTGFIGIHVGAGYHGEKKREQYSILCKNACFKGIEVLRSGGDSFEAVCTATAILEDSVITNAGIGSNLTWDGGVECDASVMESTGRYAAVGSVSSVKNPILLAREICLARSRPLEFERIPPSFLVGEGALKWAKTHGVTIIDPASMITDKTRKQHIKYKDYAQAENNHIKEIREERLDTVGAVCVDSDGKLSAAVSSGGVLLKVPGRVGQAAQYGAGVWAQQNSYYEDEENLNGVAVASSGTGEQLVTTLLARTVSIPLLTSTCPSMDLHHTIKHCFLGSPFLKDEKKKLCGVLVLKSDEEGRRGELLWGHTTETMGIGYMSVNMKRPRSTFSILAKEKIGIEPIVGGVSW